MPRPAEKHVIIPTWRLSDRSSKKDDEASMVFITVMTAGNLQNVNRIEMELSASARNHKQDYLHTEV